MNVVLLLVSVSLNAKEYSIDYIDDRNTINQRIIPTGYTHIEATKGREILCGVMTSEKSAMLGCRLYGALISHKINCPIDEITFLAETPQFFTLRIECK